MHRHSPLFLMAGHINADDSLKDGDSRLNKDLLSIQDIIYNHNAALFTPTLHPSSSATSPHNELITSPPSIPLELRQNSPQDCSNLIIASVNRATVEISRTIIALNATFSQQLRQASINLTNGIKSANNSATSTIQIVVQSASIANSSAFSSVTVANRIATDANLALTSAQVSATSALSVANFSLAAATSSFGILNLSLAAATSSLNSSSLSLAAATSSLSLVNGALTSVQASASSAASSANVSISAVRLSLTLLSSQSSSDVSTLSASLALLQASVSSLQVSQDS